MWMELKTFRESITIGQRCKPAYSLCKWNKSFFWQRFAPVPKVLATVRHAGSGRPQDAMNTWIEELQEDHFRLCLREVKTFDGKHQNIQVLFYQMHWKSFNYTSFSVTHGSIIILEWPLVLEDYQISLGGLPNWFVKSVSAIFALHVSILQFSVCFQERVLGENPICWESVSTALQLIAGSPYCTTSSVNRRGRAPVTMLRKKKQ